MLSTAATLTDESSRLLSRMGPATERVSTTAPRIVTATRPGGTTRAPAEQCGAESVVRTAVRGIAMAMTRTANAEAVTSDARTNGCTMPTNGRTVFSASATA